MSAASHRPSAHLMALAGLVAHWEPSRTRVGLASVNWSHWPRPHPRERWSRRTHLGNVLAHSPSCARGDVRRHTRRDRPVLSARARWRTWAGHSPLSSTPRPPSPALPLGNMLVRTVGVCSLCRPAAITHHAFRALLGPPRSSGLQLHWRSMSPWQSVPGSVWPRTVSLRDGCRSPQRRADSGLPVLSRRRALFRHRSALRTPPAKRWRMLTLSTACSAIAGVASAYDRTPPRRSAAQNRCVDQLGGANSPLSRRRRRRAHLDHQRRGCTVTGHSSAVITSSMRRHRRKQSGRFRSAQGKRAELFTVESSEQSPPSRRSPQRPTARAGRPSFSRAVTRSAAARKGQFRSSKRPPRR